MPSFAFTARDPKGRTQRGIQQAGSAIDLAAQLRQRGWLVLNVQAAGDSGESGILELIDPRNWLPIRSIDVEMTLTQIAVMLRSGLTLLAALNTAGEHADRYRLRKVLRNVMERIQEGSSFSDALAQHRCFNQLTVQLVKVGEQTGNLDVVIERASEGMERSRLLKSQVITALTYPVIVLVAALGVTGFMIVGVIPKLQVFLKVMGHKLPPSTQLLLDISAWTQVNGLTTVTVTAAIIGGLMASYSLPQGRLIMDRAMLRIPLLGRIFRVAATALFARGMCIMVQSGVTVLEALRTLARLGRNRYLTTVVDNARTRVFAGGGLSESLTETKDAFMPMLGRMTAVGEAAGTLDIVLDEVATFHETLLGTLIRQLSSLVEPAIIVFVGGIVGYVYITFFLALYAAAGPTGK